MKKKFDPVKNYYDTREAVGYTPRKKATQKTYDDLGFMSGLEVHQQIDTVEKLFCRCPAGCYHHNDVFDAEVIRHMRPTLSELGEYDGTALMEFKTKKEIVYRIKNETTCTYEVDDTPPFPLNREALEKAIKISLLSKLKIVGEVHITRKQYLDGSIPTGFQRTAIIGVEGEIPLKNKKIRLIQLSLEEDSCREVSDIRHTRIYKTDRLGMPLIETVTYPDMVNPMEVKEACDYIRFMNRSTGLVRVGIGAGREDVNVSCRGGSRVEIKGVAHTKWIPELTHNECYRQWALLQIKKILNERISDAKHYKIDHAFMSWTALKQKTTIFKEAKANKYKLVAVNLPHFQGILSHFTQPGKMFANEISDRLKVIACLEKPNMTHSEEFEPMLNESNFEKIRKTLKAREDDAQIVFWGPEEDITTALDVIEERCRMALAGVPNETRKSFEGGITIFERVLPGADRMYPDTDSKPIPLPNKYIEDLSKDLPMEVIERYHQLKKWGVPEDTYTFIFKRNYYPMIARIIKELKQDPKFVGTFFGHTLKFVKGHFVPASKFSCEKIYELFKFVKEEKLDVQILKQMLPVVFEHPQMDFESVLVSINFKRIEEKEIVSYVPYLKEKFKTVCIKNTPEVEANWIMGELRKKAVGNISMKELHKVITKN